MHREAWCWILGGSLFSNCAHSITSLTIFIEPFPWLRDPSCDSFNPEMFAECAGLGPQYKTVSGHSWTFRTSQSHGGKTHARKHAHKREAVCKPEDEWSVKASEQAMLLCILKRFRGLLSRTTLAVFFPSHKNPPLNLVGCRAQPYVTRAA